MTQRFRTGGFAAWSIRRPISVSMLSLAVVVLGFFSLDRLNIDLLPHLIYPDVRVRVIDPGVPARIMEDQVTRQLEEQLAITEGAIAVQSTTREGRTSVNLSFPYGTDIDIALRDASNRLDRAKRFLPTSIDPPVIYKRDPSQIPVLELAVSSTQRDATALREWVDYEFGRWFLNLPGVAAAEVGGGTEREIQVLVDQERLASLNLDFSALADRLAEENVEIPGGRMNTMGVELSTRTLGRFQSVDELKHLPLWQGSSELLGKETVRLGDVAQVFDSHEDERFHVRLNGQEGVKLSIQKQPEANTVAVVDTVLQRLAWLEAQQLIPADIQVNRVSDQALYVRHALRNASMAALSGAILAMLVVYLFLGNLRRTLIIGSAIPLAILVTIILMALGGLTLNLMTLGGLALGVGLLVDNTIVMLENITRHQRLGEGTLEAPLNAAIEVTSPIIGATGTNLAAILPFLFVGGLLGLLFSEMIFTLSAAILASLLVALTVVPALGARVQDTLPAAEVSRRVDTVMHALQNNYTRLLGFALRRPGRPVLVLLPLLLLAVAYLAYLYHSQRIFLPQMDEGRISVSVIGDTATQLNEMDAVVHRIENLIAEQPEVQSVFTTVGVFIFGRSEHETSNRSSINVQLTAGNESEAWIRRMRKQFRELGLTGFKIRMRVRGVRGIHLGSGDDDFSLRVQGPDLTTLTRIGEDITARISNIPGLRNVQHTYEEIRDELAIKVDRERATDLNMRITDIGEALRVAMAGIVVSEFIEGDRQYDIRLRLPRSSMRTPDDIEGLLVGFHQGRPIRLREVATVNLALSPSTVMRDRQRRIVEISGSLAKDTSLDRVMATVQERLLDYTLPDGYALYDGGANQVLREGQQAGVLLVSLAIFLVFVVMAIQYESLRNPLVILLTIPFALIGVALGLWTAGLSGGSWSGIPLSMPVWLGLIMLAGIVVNNAIVLVEQVELEREKAQPLREAITTAARLRLRPILMTTLTTVFGMLPLALGLGEGSEMLQPLAIVIVWGLFFSMLVSLVLVPAVYALMRGARAADSRRDE